MVFPSAAFALCISLANQTSSPILAVDQGSKAIKSAHQNRLSEPKLEGWWFPEGNSPHPSQLPTDTRNRVRAAIVQLGHHATGVFVDRQGLVITSASAVKDCVEALKAEGKMADELAFVASPSRPALICPDMVAKTVIEVRDVTDAVFAAERAGSSKVQNALLTACNNGASRRSCQLVTTENLRHRLVVLREMSPVRLHYWPGKSLSNIGGTLHSFSTPRLGFDVALLQVSVGQSGAPGRIALSEQRLRPNAPLWIGHHPGQSLRWASTEDAVLFIEKILPAYLKQAQNAEKSGIISRKRVALELLSQHKTQHLYHIRTRALALIHTLRQQAIDDQSISLAPFTRGRHKYRQLPWSEWAQPLFVEPGCPPLLTEYATLPPLESSLPPPSSSDTIEHNSLPPPSSSDTIEHKCPHKKYEFASQQPQRQQILKNVGYAPAGSDGQGDLRISRARMVMFRAKPRSIDSPQPQKSSPKNLPPYASPQIRDVSWQDLLKAGQVLNRPLDPLPKPLPWPNRRSIGFEIYADLGPLATGGPVINASGELVGIISGGDILTLAGLYRYHPQAKVSITAASAIRTFFQHLPDTADIHRRLSRR